MNHCNVRPGDSQWKSWNCSDVSSRLNIRFTRSKILVPVNVVSFMLRVAESACGPSSVLHHLMTFFGIFITSKLWVNQHFNTSSVQYFRSFWRQIMVWLHFRSQHSWATFTLHAASSGWRQRSLLLYWTFNPPKQREAPFQPLYWSINWPNWEMCLSFLTL